MEETLVSRAGLNLVTIQGGPIVGVPLLTRLKNLLKLAGAVGPVWQAMSRFRPDVLFMTGGYVNAPVAFVARLRGVPALIYLPDIEPGTAIRWLSRFARLVACTAEASKSYFPAGKTVVTGYPVRSALRAAANMARADALHIFDLTPDRRTLFVFGGSRGARSINRALIGILPQLLTGHQVIHISGNLDWSEVEQSAQKLPPDLRRFYRPFAYLHEEMGAAFRAADLVVARAGASMLGECPAFGLPALLVPYPYAWRYQKVNADFLAERGAAIRLDDERLATELLPTVQALFADKSRLAEMAAAAQALDIPDATGRLGDTIVAIGQKNA
jgi:UDP-N-acetylglucosamine--N-acetylmuramyl-(pentapeptide) pyrophosphoryl-undecaprenol N-acetylglucosamine transferase